MNHDGSLGTAQRFIETAAACGADIVKFQVHLAEAETLRDAPAPAYFRDEPRYDYFKRTAFTFDQWKALKAKAGASTMGFLASVFSREAVDLLERIGVTAYKIPSGEVTNLPLLTHVAKTGKPVYLSSGMSNWAELDAAVAALRAGGSVITLFQCTSEYPCPSERVGLNVLGEMRERYSLPIGLSDHTITNYASFAAIAQGAVAIEKHLTLSRQMYGSDAMHSLEPAEFAELVQGVRAIETMQAHPVNKDDVSRYQEMKRVFQKSLVARVDIAAGAEITPEMLTIKKPGTGISAARFAEVVGRKAARSIQAEAVVRETDVDWNGGAGR